MELVTCRTRHHHACFTFVLYASKKKKRKKAPSKFSQRARSRKRNKFKCAKKSNEKNKSKCKTSTMWSLEAMTSLRTATTRISKRRHCTIHIMYLVQTIHTYIVTFIDTHDGKHRSSYIHTYIRSYLYVDNGSSRHCTGKTTPIIICTCI